MRIAVVTTLFPVLSETPFLNQVTGLVRRGHDVDVFADRAQPGVAPHPDVAALGLDARTHYPLALPPGTARRWREAIRRLRAAPPAERRVLLRTLDPLRFWRRAWSLQQFAHTIRYLGRAPYDVCYGTFGQDALKALRVRRAGALGGALVAAFRGADVTKYVSRRGARVYRRLFAEGDLFLPVCDALARRVIAIGAPPDRVVVHRTGIDLRRFCFRTRPPAADGRLRVLTVGRLVEKKGIGDALEAVRALADAGVDLEYEVAGDGPLRRTLEARIAELGVGNRVRLLGWQSQEQIRAALDRADVLAAPSVTAANGDEEGIPNVLKEAMAVGLPVIATRHSGIPELVEDGVSGLLVPERDPRALAEGLRRLAGDPGLRAALGRAGRAAVERDYDIERLNDRLVELFRTLTRDTCR